jgi:hypothetical protein
MSTPPLLLRHAWLIVILLMPVALLNYLDRQMLASESAPYTWIALSLGGCHR